MAELVDDFGALQKDDSKILEEKDRRTDSDGSLKAPLLDRNHCPPNDGNTEQGRRFNAHRRAELCDDRLPLHPHDRSEHHEVHGQHHNCGDKQRNEIVPTCRSHRVECCDCTTNLN